MEDKQDYWKRDSGKTRSQTKRFRSAFWVLPGIIVVGGFLARSFFEFQALPVSPVPFKASEGAISASINATPGFQLIQLNDSGISFLMPDSWEQRENQYFRDGRALASSMMGNEIKTGEPVYSAGGKGQNGEPLAFLQVLVEAGPAPSQPQVTEMLEAKKDSISRLPELTAAQFESASLPGVSLKVRESDWASNGRILCQKLSIETRPTGASGQILRQWSCFNSSSVIWFSITSPTEAENIYGPISEIIWQSLDFEIDPVTRLR